MKILSASNQPCILIASVLCTNTAHSGIHVYRTPCDHRGPRQSVCRNWKDLHGNILRFIFKSKYWVDCSYVDQNKRKLTSSVVFCRPCGWQWRISACWRFCVRRLFTFILVNIWTFYPIFRFKYEPQNIPIQILSSLTHRLSGCAVVWLQRLSLSGITVLYMIFTEWMARPGWMDTSKHDN